MNCILAAALALLAAVTVPANAACMASGGDKSCQPEQPHDDYQFSICDDVAPTMGRVRAWCEVFGGSWEGTPNPVCVGGNFTISNSEAAGAAASQFELKVHGPSCGSGPQPGACSNNHCNCTNAFVGNVQTRSYAVLPFSGANYDSLGQCTLTWSENVVVAQTRPAGCPKGFYGGVVSGCEMPPPCDDCLGNPVDVGNLTKRQKETDYTSGAPGGLTFARYYVSAGFFDFQSRDAVNGDFWRHSYASRVVPVASNAYLMAVVVRPTGDPLHFNTSGVEKQNNKGAAHRLQKLVDGGGAVTGWRLTTPEHDVELYDAAGKLTSITTRSGFVTTLTYGTSGALDTVTDAFGRTLTFTYDTSGRMATMTDPASRQFTYAYDAKGRLSTVTYPGSQVRTYHYESANHKFGLTGITDERGTRYATYGYDTNGHAISTEHAGSDNKYTFSYSETSNTFTTTVVDAFNTSHTYTFSKVAGAHKRTQHTNSYQGSENRTYDTNGNPLTFTDRRGMLTTYVYDASRNLETSRTEASGTSLARTITTTWHATYRQPATITEPSGVSGVSLVTEFTHDTAGNVTKKKMTAGAKVREWNYTYNSRGQVLTIDGPRTDVTDVTTLTYYGDSDTCVGCRGQVNTVTNAAGHVTTFNTYNADGRPIQITDPNGVVTTLAYKPRGWLESRTVGGETTAYDYDAMGNLTKVTLPDSSWVGYGYDAAGALIGVDDALGNSIDYELDVRGNRVQEVVLDSNGALRKSMQRVYDSVSRLQKELGALAQATVYGYDNNSNITTVTDPLFRVTTNIYDTLNRLTNVNDPASGNTVFTYDAKDRLLTVKDPKISTATAYTYDGLGNLLTQVSPDTGTTTFTYDNAGNVATQTDARSTVTTYGYDTLNRVTAATVTDGTATYEYDNTTTGGSYAKGRLTKVTDPSGTTTYVYDSLGRVTSKTQSVTSTPSNKSFTVGYSFSSGRQTGITYPSGRAITYGFNALGQVISISVDGTSVMASGEYFPFGPVKKWTWGNGQVMERAFDTDGRIAGLTLGPSSATYPDLTQVFGYDTLNRLTTANLAAGQTQGFTYDANSNRLTATVNTSTTTYTYPSTSHKLSALSGATTRSFTYDNAGNITNTASVTYVYDGRGRMKQAGATTYLVNGLGQRLKKSTASVDTYFAYDEAGRLLGEYDTAGVAIQETVWLGDVPVAVVKPASPSGFTLFYIWADHLGTPRQITDTTNQSRWEWAHSDPFGNNSPNENPAAVGNFTYNLRFAGQYFDVETGTHYNMARDYDPRIGRYLESDPIGLEGGINTYSYVEANPLGLTDPTGLEPGGPYHSPASTRCTRFDTCSVLKGKMHELERMINSHQGWDWRNPPPRGGGRHATEIGELWNAYARCQSIYSKKKCKDDEPLTCGKDCQKTLVAIRDAVTGAILFISLCIAAAAAP